MRTINLINSIAPANSKPVNFKNQGFTRVMFDEDSGNA